MCCPYGDTADFRRSRRAFDVEARRNGLRVAGALSGPADPGAPVDPDRLLASHAAATEAALADGFRGLAVSADVTDLVRTPEQQDAFARYEFLLDRYASGHPLSALCCYRLDLGDDLVAEFATLHTVGPSGAAALRVFGRADGALGVGGPCDPASVAVLGRVLTRLRAGADDGALVVDLAGVEHLDHRVLLTLSDHARTTGVVLTLQSVPPFATRLMELMPASYLRLPQVGGQT